MRLTISTVLASTMMLLTMSLSAYGQGGTPAAGQDAANPAVAPASSAAVAPEASPTSAKDDDAAKKEAEEAAEKAKQLEAVKKALALARDYLVTVSIEWQKDQGEYPQVQTGEGFLNYTQTLIERKQPSETLGMMVDPAQGLIISADHRGEDRFIKSVSGLTSQGQSFALERYGFYLDMNAAAYRTKAWPGRKDAPEWFTGPMDASSLGAVVSLHRDDLGWSVSLGASGAGRGLVQQTDGEDLDVSGLHGLILDDESRPVGFTAGGRISLTGERYPWRGSDLGKRSLMTFEEFAKLRHRLENEIGRYAHEVRIVYRQSEGEESNLTFEGEDPSSLTQYYYGYAVSPTRILVPLKLEKIYIQRFKEITVELNGKSVPAKFLGA